MNSMFYVYAKILACSLLASGFAYAQDGIPLLVKKTKPAIVTVYTFNDAGDTISQGSGFFINSGGDIITCRHVIENASSAIIKTTDDRIYTIKNILAEDPAADIVLLNIDNETKKMKYLSICEDLPVQGEHVLVIGSPKGLQFTVTDGIVSAIRDVQGIGHIIQTSAPISPGSSGGPMVNMSGLVIGVATFQLIEGQNLNFAVSGKNIAAMIRDKKKNPPAVSAINTDFLSILKEINIESAAGYYAAGQLYAWDNRPELALFCFRRSLETDSLNGRCYFHIAQCLEMLSRDIEAMLALKQAVSMEQNAGDKSEGYASLATLYLKFGLYEEALNNINLSIKCAPNSPLPYGIRGWIHYRSGKYDNAVADFKKSLTLNCANEGSYIGLALTYFALGDKNEAMNSYKNAININNSFAQTENLPDELGREGIFYSETDLQVMGSIINEIFAIINK